MPKVGLVCPDGTKVLSADCLSKCRMGSRCLTKSTLASMCYDRPMRTPYKPSTTTLLKPSLIAYLELTQPYFVDPQDLAWMFIGSRAHAKLEKSTTDVSTLEKFFADENETGILDCLECECGVNTLTDYKVVGAFSVAKMLGMTATGKKPSPTGERYQKSGKWGKAGDLVMVNTYTAIPEKADLGDYPMQVNRYRRFCEVAGLPIHRMQLQCIVRDGGLQATREKGIDRNIYVIPIQKIEDAAVESYFAGKREVLLTALNANVAPPVCTYDERWQNRRCKGYCNVAESCDWGQRVLRGEIK